LEVIDMAKIRNDKSKYLSRAKLLLQSDNSLTQQIQEDKEIDCLKNSYIDDNWYLNFSKKCETDSKSQGIDLPL